MSTRIAFAVAALLIGLLAAFVGVGGSTLVLVFAVARGGEHVAVGLGAANDLAPSVALAPSAQARAEIPAPYLALYMQAAARFGTTAAIQHRHAPSRGS
jgi:uncharacterized membrane protein YfcA